MLALAVVQLCGETDHRIDLIKNTQIEGNGRKLPCLMTAYSHTEIKLFQITSKVLQTDRLLTKFNNFGYHTVLCGLAFVNLSGADSILVLHLVAQCRSVQGEYFRQYDKNVIFTF